jgi:hypothetical protein
MPESRSQAATGGVSDSSIRATGVSLGLVDYKVGSLNHV